MRKPFLQKFAAHFPISNVNKTKHKAFQSHSCHIIKYKFNKINVQMRHLWSFWTLKLHMYKGAVKVQNLQGVNTTKKILKNTTRFLKKKHYRNAKNTTIISKMLPYFWKKHYRNVKKTPPILKNTTIFLKKHYWNAKKHYQFKKHCHIFGKTLPKLKKHYQYYPLSTPCPVRTTGGRPPVPPVLAAPLPI